MRATVYLIPTVLAEGVIQAIPVYVTDAIRSCSVLFTENERTTRRYLKLLMKDIVIDNYEWFNMKDGGAEVISAFRQCLGAGKTIGILSEAGCPGIADPGQQLVAVAQELNIPVKPLVGPNSILLALMASGMNGQHFTFHGYLPIEAGERAQVIRRIEAASAKNRSTEIFIETPYRNNQLLQALVKTCQPKTRICVAVDLTAPGETIRTQTAAQWKNSMPDIHKRPAIFLLDAS
ncbi:MAG TPA: SAM-dependent methyltransferase [Flavisolibacter sp.]